MFVERKKSRVNQLAVGNKMYQHNSGENVAETRYQYKLQCQKTNLQGTKTEQSIKASQLHAFCP